MTYTADSVVIGVDPRDMSRDAFKNVLADARSPALREADASYDVLTVYDVSIAFLLAVFHHESQYATDPKAIVANYATMNPGNCRSARAGKGKVVNTNLAPYAYRLSSGAITPATGPLPPGATAITGNRGPFIKYDRWVDGWEDLAFRLVDESYVYVREHRKTIRQVLERFAPKEDNNSPESYIKAVVADMNRWAGATIVAGDDSRFQWIPDTSEFGYPQGTHGRNGKPIDYLIVHVTEGTDSLSWLVDAHESSAHYLTTRDGTPRAQMVAEADAAWTAGNRDYNERGINIEFERKAAQAWTAPDYRRAAATCYPILKRNNIPLVFLGRDSVGKRGLLGHEHVPDGQGGWGGTSHHADPGKNFNWSTFIAELRALDGPPPSAQFFPETGHTVGGGFLQFWLNHGGLLIFGYPITQEFIEKGHTVQYFERARFEHHPNTNPELWDVMLGRIGAELIGYDE